MFCACSSTAEESIRLIRGLARNSVGASGSLRCRQSFCRFGDARFLCGGWFLVHRPDENPNSSCHHAQMLLCKFLKRRWPGQGNGHQASQAIYVWRFGRRRVFFFSNIWWVALRAQLIAFCYIRPNVLLETSRKVLTSAANFTTCSGCYSWK